MFAFSGDMPIGIGNGIRVEFAGITIVLADASINNEIADVYSFGPHITSQACAKRRWAPLEGAKPVAKGLPRSDAVAPVTRI
jgi:hypothetical protein